ncbi:MAG: hypothetical protein KDD50_16685 [Bdellovibrionales bacterium]|nr:hypothetical protein [Bdellovibrionales bacterium]
MDNENIEFFGCFYDLDLSMSQGRNRERIAQIQLKAFLDFSPDIVFYVGYQKLVEKVLTHYHQKCFGTIGLSNGLAHRSGEYYAVFRIQRREWNPNIISVLWIFDSGNTDEKKIEELKQKLDPSPAYALVEEDY